MSSNSKGLPQPNSSEFTRRQFIKTTLTGIAAVGTGSIGLPALAAGKPKEIVHANWGGDALKCHNKIHAKPFTKKYGVKVLIDGSGPLEGKIKAMAEKKNVIWDCADADWWNGTRLGQQGLLEPIDWSIVDKSKNLFSGRYASMSYSYAYPIVYDKSKVGDDPPKNWADFWNVKKYPGKRCLYKWLTFALEAALMADGVQPDSLYPLDIDRALNKLKEIKDHLIFWQSGAESQQMLLQGEVVMGQLWNTRASVLEKDTNGRVTWTWNQAIFSPANWIVPKGNPAGREWAMRWLAFMQDPTRQVEMLKCVGFGTANPETFKLTGPELRRINSSDPENLKLMVQCNQDFYGKHYDEMLNRYLDLISSF